MSKKRKPSIKGKKLNKKDLQHAILALFRRFPKKQFNPRQVISKLKIANDKGPVQKSLEQLVRLKKIEDKGDYKFQLIANYAETTSKNTAIGRVDMTRTGAAYVIIDGEEDDIFVAARYINSAMDGDIVKIRHWTARGRRKPDGEVIQIIKRAADQFVGILTVQRQFAFVRVEGKQDLDILVDLDHLNKGSHGDMVVVKITDWTSRRFDNPKGIVTSVLGEPGSSNLDMQAILINAGFNIDFPEEVIKESEAIDETITEEEIAKRRDFRDTLTITIDPLTAKDFDDAISYEELEDGRFEIGVHIADVSHYVKRNSALDKEAYRRSTSVYLVDRVCPMLPEKLSNVLCSLRPREDKLTFSATFTFDKAFNIVDRWFGKAIIHSDRRFTYEEAQEVIETGEGDHAKEIIFLNTLAKALRKERFKKGSIDFDSEEVRFRLDEDGTPLEVYVKERKEAHLLVEDFMLLANREVAAFISRKEQTTKTNIPFVYRVHDDPDPDKAMELARFAAALGFEMDVSSAESIGKSYNRLVEAARKDPALKMLTPLAIRTMSKAEYTPKNIGHYGLGFDHYTHFTSPIRRYSDVLVHRILFQNLGNKTLKVDGVKLEEQCKHISLQERKAAEAERESIKYKQVEFIEKHIGEAFAGIVNGITNFGLFVELKESRCEGMVAYDQMDQPYELGAGRLSMRGNHDGKIIRMGDELVVKVLHTDLKRRRIELAYVDGPVIVKGDNVLFIPAKEEAKDKRIKGKDYRRSKSGGSRKSKDGERGKKSSQRRTRRR